MTAHEMQNREKQNEKNRNRTRIMLVGPSMAGKTTLCQYLNREELAYHKTQTVEVVNGTMIDTPGEYLERTGMRGALTVTATASDLVILVQPADAAVNQFPPGYAGGLGKPCIGVVTKADLGDEKQIWAAEKSLKEAGAEEVFITSSYEGTGFPELLEYLDRKNERNQEPDTESPEQ